MGPVMSSLPVRQAPASASVDGHGSSSVRESLSMGARQPGYLLLCVVSAEAASMIRSERDVVCTPEDRPCGLGTAPLYRVRGSAVDMMLEIPAAAATR